MMIPSALQAPVHFVHNDYTDTLREHLIALADGQISYTESDTELRLKPRRLTAAQMRAHRTVMINVWRSTTE